MSARIDPVLYAEALAEIRAIPTRPAATVNSVPSRGQRRKLSGPSRVKCGTYTGYVKHRKRGEDACEPCLKAKREYYRAYYAANAKRILSLRRRGDAR